MTPINFTFGYDIGDDVWCITQNGITRGFIKTQELVRSKDGTFIKYHVKCQETGICMKFPESDIILVSDPHAALNRVLTQWKPNKVY